MADMGLEPEAREVSQYAVTSGFARVYQAAGDLVVYEGGERSGDAVSLPGRWVGCPYRGLKPFDDDYAAVFYGREETVAQLLEVMGGRLSAPGLIMVTGASGVGKSSLLRAGLLPALATGQAFPGCDGWPHFWLTRSRPAEWCKTTPRDLFLQVKRSVPGAGRFGRLTRRR